MRHSLFSQGFFTGKLHHWWGSQWGWHDVDSDECSCTISLTLIIDLSMTYWLLLSKCGVHMVCWFANFIEQVGLFVLCLWVIWGITPFVLASYTNFTPLIWIYHRITDLFIRTCQLFAKIYGLLSWNSRMIISFVQSFRFIESFTSLGITLLVTSPCLASYHGMLQRTHCWANKTILMLVYLSESSMLDTPLLSSVS